MFLCRPSWDGFLQQLRDVEKLLANTYTREQFVDRCVEKGRDAFASWGARLKGLRWEVLAKFCSEVPCLISSGRVFLSIPF